MSERSTRLFFALWPDDKLREQLDDVTRPLRELCDGRAVPPDNYHITLEFLGNVSDELIDAVVEAAGTVNFAPFAFSLDRWGCFSGPQVAWYGPSSYPPALGNLVRDLRQALEPCVTLSPERLYTPHVTAIRKQVQLPELPAPRKLVWNAHEFVLVESIFGPGQAIYKVRNVFPSS